jgi:hypothetical protein
MGLRDRLTAGAAQLADTAATRARDAVLHGDHTGARLLALLRMEDDRPLTVENLLVLLVDAVRGDDDELLTERDVVKAAKRRQRRLGTMAVLGGPTGLRLVSLYCEVAILCDLEQMHGLGLSDEQMAGHLLVLWNIMPSHEMAMAAIEGRGPSVADSVGDALHGTVVKGAADDGRITKREAVLMVWRLRGVTDDLSMPGSSRARDVLLPGSRVKELKAAAEHHLTRPG